MHRLRQRASPFLHGGWRLALGLWALGLGLSAAPASFGQTDLWPDEGPLANDTFVATSPEREAALRVGDALWQQAQATEEQGGDGAATRLRALDAWHAALGTPSDSPWVRGVDPESLWPEVQPERAAAWRRLTLSVHNAVRFRLQQTEALSAWSERFAPLAQRALDAVGHDPRGLQQLEERFPWTPGAATAALRMADWHRERVEPFAARAWLERAREHLGELAQREPWASHLEARTEPEPSTDPGAGDGEWRYLRAWRLESRRGQRVPGELVPLGRGSRPGAVLSAQGSLTIQTDQAFVHIDRDVDGLPQPGARSIEGLAALLGLDRIQAITPASTGGWPHRPATDGQRLYAVVDRARAGSTRFDIPIPPRGNYLVAFERTPGRESRVLWQRATQGWRSGEGPWVQDGLQGTFEWQPGPVVLDGKLWVLARSMVPVEGETAEGPLEAFVYLMAFDARTGRWLHQTKIHKASDLTARDEASMARQLPTPTAPLGVHRATGQLLVQTNQGLCGVFDGVRGEARWLFSYRRRSPRAEGWPGSYDPVVFGRRWWVMPGDSDRTYGLELARGAWPLRGAWMEPIGERALGLAWDERGRTYLARRGARGVVWNEPEQGPPQFSFLLGREEHFMGQGWVAPQTLWCSTNRSLYRLDRGRELALEYHVALPDEGAGVGGEILLHGDSLWVLGPDTVWLLMRR